MTDNAVSKLTEFIVLEFRRTFERDEVDVDSNLFELGLDSLGAVKFVTQLEKGLPVDVALLSLLVWSPTVAELAEGITDELEPDELAKVIEYVDNQLISNH